jgi:hypothetical protein
MINRYRTSQLMLGNLAATNAQASNTKHKQTQRAKCGQNTLLLLKIVFNYLHMALNPRKCDIYGLPGH